MILIYFNIKTLMNATQYYTTLKITVTKTGESMNTTDIIHPGVQQSSK